MTEVEKLFKRLKGVRNMGVTLGDGENITAEDVAREVNKALDQIE